MLGWALAAGRVGHSQCSATADRVHVEFQIHRGASAHSCRVSCSRFDCLVNG